jgi:hypothetical protein
MVQWYSPLLEDFIAPEIGSFRRPEIPKLDKLPNYFGSLFVNNIFVAKQPKRLRQLVAVFVRRIGAATDQYILAAAALDRFESYRVNSNEAISAYLRALIAFETCVLHSAIAVQCLRSITTTYNLPGPFKTNDGSDYDRLHKLSNRIKHFNEDLEQATSETAILPTPIWLADDGIRCTGAQLEFQELFAILCAAHEDCKGFTEDWFRDVVAKRKDATL